MTNEFFMQQALEFAKKAALVGEVPVGAVIVKNNTIIAHGLNTVETEHNPAGHAEINAIKSACAALNTTRLTGCILYTTLEPCAMCAGAIIHARIAKVVFAAHDDKFGAAGSICNLFAMNFNHNVDIKSGVLAGESITLLQNFFKSKR